MLVREVKNFLSLIYFEFTFGCQYDRRPDFKQICKGYFIKLLFRNGFLYCVVRGINSWCWVITC